MNTTPGGPSDSKHIKEDKEEGWLEKIAHILDPGGREISDDELVDPGKNIHDEIPEADRPKRIPPDAK